MDNSKSFPRLMITKIVCENFKSYAGVKELGPFHKCFSSIVGPNGSGKSNVIDSMLFVFGYRARRIRSKSVAILIHNSQNHQNITSCSVSVHFQKIIDLPGVDGYDVVHGSQFIVSRTAFKDNSSHYQLNGKKTPFKEISILLREAGIDLDHNRFLILQGEVEQIALMKPKAQTEHDEGMLEFLEDIIGTSQYKEPIEELYKKMDELNDTRGEKLNRYKAIEKEKNQLEGAKMEAEEYLAMQKNISLKQYQLYGCYKEECLQLETKAMEKKVTVEEKLKEVKECCKESKTEGETKMKKKRKLAKKHEELVEVRENAKSIIKSCEQRDVRYRQDIKNCKNQYKKMSKNLEKEREKLKEHEDAPERCAKEIEEGKAKIIILEKRKVEAEEGLSEVMSRLQEDTQELQDEKKELESKLIVLSQTVNETKSKLEVSLSELEAYKEKCTAGERQLKQAKDNYQTTETTIDNKNGEIKTFEESVINMDKELVTCRKNLLVAKEKSQTFSNQLKSSRSQMQDAQSQKSSGQIIGALMEQKSTGNIPGICGRLGDLGTIPDKYDVAVSTASPALDYVVVDTMETGIKCVEFLKNANLGTTTFIAMDKMERFKRNVNTKISTPQNVPRLFDLVVPKDPKYSTAFYFALRDMLIADTLDQATKIGLQGQTRHNVVTLEGHVINQTGTMTGGGTRVTKGKMSSKLQSDYTPEQVIKMKKKLESEEASYEKYSQEYSELETKIAVLEKEIGLARKKIKQLKKDLQVLCEQEKGMAERIKLLERQGTKSKIDPKEVAKLEKVVGANQKDYDRAAVNADEVKSMVKGLTEEINRIGGTRVQEQQKFVDKIKKDLEDTLTAVNKATVTIKSSERNANKSREKIESSENEISSLNEKIESLKSDLKSLEEEYQVAMTNQKTAENQLEELEQLLTEIRNEIQEIENKQREANEVVLDLNHELERYNAIVKENQLKIKHFNNEIAKLSLSEEELSAEDTNNTQLSETEKQEIEYRITMLEERLKQMTPNMSAIDEYKNKEEILLVRLNELNSITNERDCAHKDFEDMRKRRFDEFMAGFTVITSKLKEMYQMITLGGDAELELVDSLDPFSEGIVFSVRPPKKSWKNISNLSGGEKTLSSLALVFALHHYKPSPLYVMDEIDAALDFKNVSIVAHYIKERTKNAQFIIISLRNNMFELADRLVGIYKTDNCTKSVTVDPLKIKLDVPSSQPSPLVH